jgi:predicted  nucleic acid-binding Zn-ribbon protein
MAGRKHRPGHPSGAPSTRARKLKRARPQEPQTEDKDAEIERLSRELAEAQAKLLQIEERGVDAFTARKIETLLEAAQIARGQAFDASLARNKAEGELRALQKAIAEARGPAGWLLRRAARRLQAKP